MDDFPEGIEHLTPEQREANRERNLRRIAEGWAEHAALTLELEELQRIDSPSPAQLRRIAELVEKLRGKTAALLHWKTAAEAGNMKAKAWLAVWDEEMKDPVVRLLRQRVLAQDPTEHDLKRIGEDTLDKLRQYHRDAEAIRSMKPEDFE